MKLDEAQCSSMQLNAAQYTCREREPRRDRSASEASPFSFEGSAGICRDMLGAAAQCWSLLRSVPKLIKFKARFPFFVRQVSELSFSLQHICKVLKIRFGQVGPLSELGPTKIGVWRNPDLQK